MRGGRIAIALVATVLLGLLGAAGALACSCAPATPSQSLAASDAAIVGRLLSVEPHGGSHAAYRYEILGVYRGASKLDRGSIVEVIGPRVAAACALPDRIGRRYGLFLLSGRGRWWSGLCAVVAPKRLRAAARRPLAGAEAGFPNCAA